MKICSKCKQELPYTAFYKNSSKKDGYNYYCKECQRPLDRIGSKKRRKYLVSNNLCQQCGKYPILARNRCEKCFFEAVSTINFHTNKYGQVLHDLLIKQNFKCIYTDEILIPGQNLSLDHIFSRKQYPDLIYDINNVQWVTKLVNSVKNELSHPDFINFCKYIAKKFE